jgi:hypothetical protein
MVMIMVLEASLSLTTYCCITLKSSLIYANQPKVIFGSEDYYVAVTIQHSCGQNG